jgi:hypothetical protein
VSAAYIAHVTTREGVSVRVEIPAAESRPHAALQAMLKVGEKSRSASARPLIEKPVRTRDCCSYRALAGVADSAFGELMA